jgi:hypothetical protein
MALEMRMDADTVFSVLVRFHTAAILISLGA